MKKIISWLSIASISLYGLVALIGMNTAQAVDQTCSQINLSSGTNTMAAGFTQTNPQATPLMASSYGGSFASAVNVARNPAWFDPSTNPNFATSTWISNNVNQPGDIGGDGSASADQWRLFKDSFSLPVNATSVSATLWFSADNAVQVYLNGSGVASTNGTSSEDVFGPVPNPMPANYSHTFSSSITPTTGSNTLNFVLRNWGGNFSSNPTGLIYAGKVNYCVPNAPATVKVTIVKYIDGQPATAVNAKAMSFSMNASWSAQNIGSGSGSFSLGPTGFNNPNPYQATTADMTTGASYSTSENLSTNCATGTPFALVGYGTGPSLAAAAAMTPTTTAPSLTNIQSDQFIVVFNKTCAPAPTTGSLTVTKTAVGGNGTFNFTGDNGLGSFSITTTNGTGSKTFTNLAPGTYHVTEGALGENWQMQSNTCSSVTVTAGMTANCNVTNVNTEEQDNLAKIAGMKFNDKNGNGKKDKGEKGVAGVTIYLDTNNNGHLDSGEPSMVTNPSGKYHFNNLAPGTYHVREVVPSGWTQTAPAGGSFTITLSAGQVSKNNNFGNQSVGPIVRGDGDNDADDQGPSANASVNAQGNAGNKHANMGLHIGLGKNDKDN